MTWQNRITRYSEEPPDQLLANPRNYRTHPGSQAAALVGVLQDVGVVQNVIANERTGYLIDGHLRVMEALKAGQPSIPVTWVDLSETEEALVLATLDPLSAMAGTDAAALDALLRDVSTDSPAVAQMLADLAAEAGPVLPEPGAGGDEFDATPDDGPTRTALGELWAIGGVHRLLVGDCTDPANVARLMGGERAGAIVSDPPYGMRLDTSFSFSKGNEAMKIKATKGYAPVIGDHQDYSAAWMFEAFPDADEIFLFGADYYVDTLPDYGKRGSWMVWDKKNEQLRNVLGLADFELIWSKQRHKRRVYNFLWNGALGTESEDTKGRVHPTQKPVRLLEAMIGEYVEGLIVDPFLGSGTTLIAAHRTGRRCYGMEIAPRYADVILRRAEAEGLTVEKISPMVCK